jgi:predicted deacylase
VTAFEIGDLEVAAGRHENGSLGEVTLASGAKVPVPVSVVNGVEEGPVLVVAATSHGREIVGAGAVIEVLRAIDASEVHGTLVTVPVVNPLAMQSATYVTPYDGVNMATASYWPGNPDGTISERLGAIVGDAFQRADFLIDVHGNAEPCAPMLMLFLEQCRDDETRRVTQELGVSFGLTPVDMSGGEAHPASLGSPDDYPVPVALSRGIPSIMIELTACGTLRDRDRGRRGIMNVMKSVGMLSGEPEPQVDPRPLEGEFRYWGALQARAAGLAWVRTEPGTVVGAGEVLLEITDAYGELLDRIESPVEGFSWWYPGAPYGFGSHALPQGAMAALIAARA